MLHYIHVLKMYDIICKKNLWLFLNIDYFLILHILIILAHVCTYLWKKSLSSIWYFVKYLRILKLFELIQNDQQGCERLNGFLEDVLRAREQLSRIDQVANRMRLQKPYPKYVLFTFLVLYFLLIFLFLILCNIIFLWDSKEIDCRNFFGKLYLRISYS